MTALLSISCSRLLGLSTLLMAALACPRVHAEDLKIEAILVWATNDEKAQQKHPAVDEPLAKELKKIFQWKYYCEVRKTNDVVLSKTTKQIDISKKCQVTITELPGEKVEVQVIGEGKTVNKTIKPLRRGEFFTIGGDVKEGGAWFVVIRQLEK